jgi:hypothetical protein
MRICRTWSQRYKWQNLVVIPDVFDVDILWCLCGDEPIQTPSPTFLFPLNSFLYICYTLYRNARMLLNLSFGVGVIGPTDVPDEAHKSSRADQESLKGACL